ncbi:MAG: bifunctional RNase H/acid phosphatase [Ilumatobacteraceae bacterium]|nr:bifunctional RNase H/acid phosphatase [Ilumatobacteraceae bacterium]
MARIHLVRHGRSEAAWADHLDPGLHADGRMQAAAVATELAEQMAPIPIWSSPLLRAQQTAAPLAATWGSTIAITPDFGEIPSPSTDPGERSAWLASAMVSRWSDLGPAIDRWRTNLLDAARGVTGDVVVFTHFVAVNAIVGAAEDRLEVLVFAPAYTSVTVVDVDPGSGVLTVERRGSEATPEVG